jgi:hypothetical protein
MLKCGVNLHRRRGVYRERNPVIFTPRKRGVFYTTLSHSDSLALGGTFVSMAEYLGGTEAMCSDRRPVSHLFA